MPPKYRAVLRSDPAAPEVDSLIARLTGIGIPREIAERIRGGAGAVIADDLAVPRAGVLERDFAKVGVVLQVERMSGPATTPPPPPRSAVARPSSGSRKWVGLGLLAVSAVVAFVVIRGRRPAPATASSRGEEARQALASGIFDPSLVYVVAGGTVTPVSGPNEKAPSGFQGSSPVIRPGDGRILYVIAGEGGVVVRRFEGGKADPIEVKSADRGGPCRVDTQGVLVAPEDGLVVVECYGEGWKTAAGIPVSKRKVFAVGRDGALLAEKPSHARLVVRRGDEEPVTGPPEYSNEDRGTIRSHEDGFWIASMGELWFVAPGRTAVKVGAYPDSPAGFRRLRFAEDRVLDAKGDLYAIGILNAEGTQKPVVVRFPLNGESAEIAREVGDGSDMMLVTGP